MYNIPCLLVEVEEWRNTWKSHPSVHWMPTYLDDESSLGMMSYDFMRNILKIMPEITKQVYGIQIKKEVFGSIYSIPEDTIHRYVKGSYTSRYVTDDVVSKAIIHCLLNGFSKDVISSISPKALAHSELACHRQVQPKALAHSELACHRQVQPKALAHNRLHNTQVYRRTKHKTTTGSISYLNLNVQHDSGAIERRFKYFVRFKFQTFIWTTNIEDIRYLSAGSLDENTFMIYIGSNSVHKDKVRDYSDRFMSIITPEIEATLVSAIVLLDKYLSYVTYDTIFCISYSDTLVDIPSEYRPTRYIDCQRVDMEKFIRALQHTGRLSTKSMHRTYILYNM